MGRRGPSKEYPHTLEVNLNDEQWRYVGEIAALTGMGRSSVVRAIVESEATATHYAILSARGKSVITIHELEEEKK